MQGVLIYLKHYHLAKIHYKLRGSGKVSTWSSAVFLSVSLHCWSHKGKLELLEIVKIEVDSLLWVLPTRLLASLLKLAG